MRLYRHLHIIPPTQATRWVSHLSAVYFHPHSDTVAANFTDFSATGKGSCDWNVWSVTWD